MVQNLFDHMLPRGGEDGAGKSQDLGALLKEYGFDHVQHDQIQADMRAGSIALAQNRLPLTTTIQDVNAADVTDAQGLRAAADRVRRELGPIDLVVLNAGYWQQMHATNWDTEVFRRHV